jgi:hypothetical protein
VADAGDVQRLMVDDLIGRPVRTRVVRNGALLDLDLVPAELEP